LKKLSDAKIQNLIRAEILYLKISSNLANFSNIFNKNRKNVLYQVFYILKTRANIASKFINSNGSDTFRKKYETKYKKEKDNAINKNNNNIKKLEKDIKDIEKNIKMLTIKETELKAEINNYFKKEKQLNDKIRTIENSNNTMKKSMQSSNISSLGTSSKYETEISSLENTIEANRQLKEGKEEIIKIFMNQVHDLLNEYQVYIDNMNNIDKSKKNNTNENNTMNIELNDYTNKQNSNLNERMEIS
jgi:chromosome segregation ATPase